MTSVAKVIYFIYLAYKSQNYNKSSIYLFIFHQIRRIGTQVKFISNR